MSETKVRVGIVGTTPYAEMHLQRVRAHPRAVITAVAGRSAERAQAVAARYQAPHVYSDYREMIDGGQIDAIIIVAPDDLHVPIALAALSAGIHVLCEKPLATSAPEAQRLVRAAEASGLVNMSYFGLRTLPHHRFLRELIDDGYLGRVFSAQFSLTHGFFRSPDYQWRFDAARGTGAFGDLGCYLIDLARWYIGDITRVSSSLKSFVARPHPDGPYEPTNDSSIVTVEFENGAHAVLTANVVAYQADRLQRNSIILHGEAGSLELEHDFTGARILGARAGEEKFAEIVIPRAFWGDADPSKPMEASLVHSVGDRAFIDAIVANEKASPEFYDGWKVQQVIDAVLAHRGELV